MRALSLVAGLLVLVIPFDARSGDPTKPPLPCFHACVVDLKIVPDSSSQGNCKPTVPEEVVVHNKGYSTDAVIVWRLTDSSYSFHRGRPREKLHGINVLDNPTKPHNLHHQRGSNDQLYAWTASHPASDAETNHYEIWIKHGRDGHCAMGDPVIVNQD